MLPENVTDLPELRERGRVFADRSQAGHALAGMLDGRVGPDALVLAIPAGGLAVAIPIALRLGVELDLAIVSKITLPWNTEAGYGAVAFDGTTRLNRQLLPFLGLSDAEIEAGKARTRAKVKRRVRELRGGRPLPRLAERSTILVDDGLASGFTMLVAVEAVRAAGAESVLVAVPTGHAGAVTRVAHTVERLFCANVRSSRPFAVADAYERWSDVTDEELGQQLADLQLQRP